MRKLIGTSGGSVTNQWVRRGTDQITKVFHESYFPDQIKLDALKFLSESDPVNAVANSFLEIHLPGILAKLETSSKLGLGQDVNLIKSGIESKFKAWFNQNYGDQVRFEVEYAQQPHREAIS